MGQGQTNIINKKAQNIELILLTFVSDYSETIVTIKCSRNFNWWFILGVTTCQCSTMGIS